MSDPLGWGSKKEKRADHFKFPLQLSSFHIVLLYPKSCLVITNTAVPEWWNGRRAGLKIR